MDLCLTVLGSFYLGIFCCTRLYLIFWGLHYCFDYVNSKLLCLNPGVLEWERISLQSLYLDYVVVVAYQIDRSNWPESCILCTFVSMCVSGVIMMVTDCFSFICLYICIACTCIDFVLLFTIKSHCPVMLFMILQWTIAINMMNVLRRCCWAKIVCLCSSYVQSVRNTLRFLILHP